MGSRIQMTGAELTSVDRVAEHGKNRKLLVRTGVPSKSIRFIFLKMYISFVPTKIRDHGVDLVVLDLQFACPVLALWVAQKELQC